MNVERELAAAIKAEQELQTKIKELKEAKKILDESAPEHKLAILLHDHLCHWNHTDGCDWHYDIHKGVHKWSGHAHQMYLTKARNIVRRCEAEGFDIARVELLAKIILETK